MLSLILNILVLLIGAGGAIVSSLTLSNPVWRKRTVIFFALMGVIGLILTVIAYENTPDVPHISDVISDVRTASFIFAKG
jgi:predicted membrane channel-forming protein YqfA (hemolysin III family)